MKTNVNIDRINNLCWEELAELFQMRVAPRERR
jgi:hypothetical protein